MIAPRLLIVADDLTGALDSAGEAARLGIGTRVFLNPAALTAAQSTDLPPVVAVSTNSRDGSADAAGAAMHEVCACLGWLAPGCVMKKVDSRLKGHVARECGILARALAKGHIITAPALPDMGRLQQDGLLYGAGIESPIDIASRFERLNTVIPSIVAAEQMAEAVVLEGLPVGARFMAGALVAQIWPDARPIPAPRLPGPVLIAIGSRDPITLRQLERLDLPRIEAPNGAPTAHHGGGSHILQMVPGTETCPPAIAGTRFATAAGAALGLSNPATLIASGGETAGAILESLGVGQLEVLGLALPGVPVALAMRPDGRALCVVTKSGGFGDASVLAHLVDLVDIPSERIETAHLRNIS